MLIIRDLSKMNNEPTIVTIGKFDGVHQGHRKLVDKLKKSGEGLKKVIFTFEFNSSVSNVVNDNPIFSEARKEEVFEELGIDYYVLYSLDKEKASMSPEDFIKLILIDRLNCKAIVCGEDFHFGKDRAGDVDFLKQMSKKYGFKLYVIKKAKYKGEDISSTRIRNTLKTDENQALEMIYGTQKTFRKS